MQIVRRRGKGVREFLLVPCSVVSHEHASALRLRFHLLFHGMGMFPLSSYPSSLRLQRLSRRLSQKSRRHTSTHFPWLPPPQNIYQLTQFHFYYIPLGNSPFVYDACLLSAIQSTQCVSRCACTQTLKWRHAGGLLGWAMSLFYRIVWRAITQAIAADLTVNQ